MGVIARPGAKVGVIVRPEVKVGVIIRPGLRKFVFAIGESQGERGPG